MNEREYTPHRGWNWPLVIAVAAVAAIVISFFLTSGPAPGWMLHARKEELEKIHARRPVDNDVAYYYAYSLMKEGDAVHAYQVMKEVVGRTPRSARYLGRLAHYAAMVGHAEETVGLYRRVLVLDPKDGEAHAELGRIFAEAELITDALNEYDQAVKLDPKVSLEAEYYARCLQRAGRDVDVFQSVGFGRVEGRRVTGQKLCQFRHIRFDAFDDALRQFVAAVGVEMRVVFEFFVLSGKRARRVVHKGFGGILRAERGVEF